MDINRIKLLIWDLDETFWKGTLSEGEISPIKENIELVKNLTDIGIINSINSKNDMDQVEKKLNELGIRKYFVFLSVNWSAKGQRIQNQINAMQLRASNVLFIDDNHLNLEEAKYYNRDLMTAKPEDLVSIYEIVNEIEKKDKENRRLNQYKLLETKYAEQQQAISNEEFLFKSDIRVEIHKDCLNKVDRIYDLIIRTNQLNFTKNRIRKIQLIELLNDNSFEFGYVSVMDRFGDYGIVGFFACKNNRLEHFMFSCRTLGMGIEQYVYSELNYPELEISGQVISDLKYDFTPTWINQGIKRINFNKMGMDNQSQVKILFKGPCDLEQIFSYIEETNRIDCEFTYVNQKTGVLIEQHNHTSQIVEGITLNKDIKDSLINELPFSDENMFSDKMFKEKYDIVFLSMLTDGNLGLYQRKESDELIAFGEYYYPLTEESNWEGYVNGDIFTANCKFNLQILSDFSNKYNFIGRIPVQQIIKNLRIIREKLNPDCLLVLMTGSETPYEENRNPAYEGRHLIHKEMNEAIREFMKEHTNVEMIEFNSYIKEQSSFYNNINHFIKPVYYNVAKDVIKKINSKTIIDIGQESRFKLMVDYSKQIVKKMLNKV
ncbi:HAD-IIIC family phosphatase [Bacillus sp. JJ722]|uniref:HAD-IIIC family phosphatase n=1 Tax=Bacillus sp. JJ722 TaxID=3122973 RepID=UPI002FFF665C